MGLTTSVNNDTHNIYIEEEYIESIETKYNELLKQNELNKLDNDNLQIDNDNLRKEIYSKQQYIESIETKYNELLSKLDNDNLRLANSNIIKVAEKRDYKQFMLDCVYYSNEYPKQSVEYKTHQIALIDSIINDPDEYIIHINNQIIITNKGKIFQRILRCESGWPSTTSYEYKYTNLNCE